MRAATAAEGNFRKSVDAALGGGCAGSSWLVPAGQQPCQCSVCCCLGDLVGRCTCLQPAPAPTCSCLYTIVPSSRPSEPGPLCFLLILHSPPPGLQFLLRLRPRGPCVNSLSFQGPHTPHIIALHPPLAHLQTSVRPASSSSSSPPGKLRVTGGNGTNMQFVSHHKDKVTTVSSNCTMTLFVFLKSAFCPL